MKAVLLKELTTELQLGITEKGHPFRCFALGSLGLKDHVGLRTVVLREVSEDLRLTFYTDNRSPKMTEIQQNDSVSALFYHPEKNWQLRIKGNAEIEGNRVLLDDIWENLPQHSKKDYTTATAPGSLLGGMDELTYLDAKNHFSMVHIVPTFIDFLKLGNSHHTRIQFSQVDGDWKGAFKVP